jgi:histidinol dehydrogenase
VPGAPLRELRWATLDAPSRAQLLARQTGRIFDPALREGVERIIEDVRLHGDEAIVRALREFDGCDVDAGSLRVSDDEIDRAYDVISGEVVGAIRQSIDHVRRYNERVLEGADWRIELEPGLMLGEKTTAIASAGLYVPSGKGSFPSVLVQIGTPAVVAGVPEIAVVVPPMPGPAGQVDPAVLVVARELGLRSVFRANGPAGIAALAFGTETIPQVLKVLGPGSPPVSAAQIEIQRHGTVSFMVLGPSESLVIADAGADVRMLAADLLNEAEHGSDSASLLVTADEQLLARVQAEVAIQLAALPEPRRAYAASAIGEVGGAVIVRDLEEAADFANLYAPEHLLVVTEDDEAVLANLEHAGEILLGQWTPFSSANYTLGVPASLPTGRYARVSSGITSRSFVKTASIARASQSAFEAIAPSVLALAEHEGFPAHAAAVRVRLDRG